MQTSVSGAPLCYAKRIRYSKQGAGALPPGRVLHLGRGGAGRPTGTNQNDLIQMAKRTNDMPMQAAGAARGSELAALKNNNRQLLASAPPLHQHHVLDDKHTTAAPKHRSKASLSGGVQSPLGNRSIKRRLCRQGWHRAAAVPKKCAVVHTAAGNACPQPMPQERIQTKSLDWQSDWLKRGAMHSAAVHTNNGCGSRHACMDACVRRTCTCRQQGFGVVANENYAQSRTGRTSTSERLRVPSVHQLQQGKKWGWVAAGFLGKRLCHLPPRHTSYAQAQSGPGRQRCMPADGKPQAGGRPASGCAASATNTPRHASRIHQRSTIIKRGGDGRHAIARGRPSPPSVMMMVMTIIRK